MPLFLRITTKTARAVMVRNSVRVENSGISFALMNIVLSLADPLRWLLLPPLLPPPFESHLIINIYVLPTLQSMSDPAESPRLRGFFNSTVMKFKVPTLIAPTPSWIASAEILPRPPKEMSRYSFAPKRSCPKIALSAPEDMWLVRANWKATQGLADSAVNCIAMYR